MQALNGVNRFDQATSRVSSSTVMQEANQAIRKWDLEKLGWRGFQQLDWVEDITNKYPEAVNIAHTCSSHTPGFLDQVSDLCDGIPKEDQRQIHNYFVGKLGLEELSCRRSGPMGGLCDKKNAFIQICQYTKGLVDG